MTSRRTPAVPARRAAAAALLAAVAVGLSGCTAGPAPAAGPASPAAPAFDDQGGTATCLAHQTRPPTDAYRLREGADTTAALRMMRYYTAQGSRDFCDGAPAGEHDRAWMRLYLDNGGTPEKVARWTASR